MFKGVVTQPAWRVEHVGVCDAKLTRVEIFITEESACYSLD